MKMIEAIVRPFKLDEVEQQIYAAGAKGMTTSEVRGFGRTGGKQETYRGSAYVAELLPKVRIQVLADDDQVTTILEAITRSSRTGEIGDGKIIISDVEEVIRVRTGERGKDAI